MYDLMIIGGGPTSVWSQRHIAYALITPRGMAMRCDSVVTDFKLPPSPKTYSSHMANCCFLEDGTCGLCAIRCPVGAITAQGHNKVRCHEYLFNKMASWREKEGYIGRYVSYGLCMTGVPCEAKIPGKVPKRFIP